MTNTIPHYLRLKPKGADLVGATKDLLIEKQTATSVKFKETTSPNKFTKVFGSEHTQEDIYNETLKDITLGLFENNDGVLFTLGPSNSGKSYTILGNVQNPGISIYALKEIFSKIDTDFANAKLLKVHFGDSFLVSSRALPKETANTDGAFGVSLSVFEIYNDKIRDLTLDPLKAVTQSLDIITDSKDGKIKPAKVRQIYVSQIEDAKLVLHKSIKRRAVTATSINGKSSRSHLFIHLNLHKIVGHSVIKTSRLTIADLAGSERTKTARTEGKSFKEGNYTNQSLTELGRCLTMMQKSKFDSSVLRTSKLTRLLLTDLFRNHNVYKKLKILLALDPYSDLSSVLHTLRYIQPVSKVPASERASMEFSRDSSQSNKFSEEIEELKKENRLLKKDKQIQEEKLLHMEMSLRLELSEEYEQRIQELDVIHTRALNELKESQCKASDEKLRLLSDDYENRKNKLVIEFESRIQELRDESVSMRQLHEEKVQSLLKFQKSADKSLELQKELEDLQRAKIESDRALMSELTQIKRDKNELQGKVLKLEATVENLEKNKENKSKKITKLMEELNENKRNSDTVAEDKFSKYKKIKIDTEEDEDDAFNFDEHESELTSFSPIILSQAGAVLSPSPVKPSSSLKKTVSPAKNLKKLSKSEFIFSDESIVSPTKNFKSIETPLFPQSVSPKKQRSPRRAALKEVNMDFVVPSLKRSPVKAQAKSPSRSPTKRKIRSGIIDDEEYEN